jgi:hypothetical protein
MLGRAAVDAESRFHVHGPFFRSGRHPRRLIDESDDLFRTLVPVE